MDARRKRKSGANTPTTFLTSKPIDATGVKTNFLEAGKDFRFPAEGAGIALGHYGNTNPFTVIFSPTALTKPGFLSSRAYRPVSPAKTPHDHNH